MSRISEVECSLGMDKRRNGESHFKKKKRMGSEIPRFSFYQNIIILIMTMSIFHATQQSDLLRFSLTGMSPPLVGGEREMKKIH